MMCQTVSKTKIDILIDESVSVDLHLMLENPDIFHDLVHEIRKESWSDTDNDI